MYRLKAVCLVLFVAVLALALSNGDRIRTVSAYAGGPPTGHTGAPGEATCVECHLGSLNQGPGQFTIIAPNTYKQGNTYQITVRHSTADTSRRAWGFELTALTADYNKAGNLVRTNTLVSIFDNRGPDLNRQYVEHNGNGTFAGQIGGASWTFNWIAPSADVGPVTFYAAGNQANGDLTPSGDQIYTASVTVPQSDQSSGQAPEIISASANRKHLFVMGDNFDQSSVLLIDGREQPTTNDDDHPTTILIGLKVIKKGKIQPGQSVTLQVRNGDDRLSNQFSYRLPE